MTIKQWKKQKLLFIKQKTKISTEACYFALKVGLNRSNKERKYKTKFATNFVFLNIKMGVLIRSGSWKEILKLINGGGYLLST